MLRKKILLIYTGGTVGMMQEKDGTLKLIDFANLKNELPEIEKLSCELHVHSFEQPLDSSNMMPQNWIELAILIEKNYYHFDGFVILHGSDTLSYTASALSFLLEYLHKPVILTGAQLSLGILRSDARENIIAAIEIASNPLYSLPEVCVYFGSKLYRGNRSTKISSESFNAFESPNYPTLVNVGVHMDFQLRHWLKANIANELKVHKKLCTDVAIFKYFPGAPLYWIESILLNPNIKGIVLETFGAGNLPNYLDFLKIIEKSIENGKILVNITQCLRGRVIQGRYETSKQLQKLGVISGHDMTTEAALTKLMFTLAQMDSIDAVKLIMQTDIRGELTQPY